MSPYYPRQEPSVPPGEPETSVATPGATETGGVGSSTLGTNTVTETAPPIDSISSTAELATSPETFTELPLETAVPSTDMTTAEFATSTHTTIILNSIEPTASSETTATPITTSKSTSSESSTTSFATVTTSINGRLTTYTSVIPTNLVESSSKQSDNSRRTGLIAGLTSGLLVFLCLFLGAIFAYRRHRRRRKAEADLAAEKKRRENRSLLDGEGFEDDTDDIYGLAMREHGVDPRLVTTPTSYVQERSGSPTLSILRSRAASDTGSIFREDVWPPPADDLVDPIVKTSSQVDLSRVVEDVMGPSHSHSRNDTDTTMASSNSLFVANGSSPPREPSLSSQYMDYGSSSVPSPRPASASCPSSYPSFTSAGTFASSSSLPQHGLTLAPLVPPPVLTTNITSSPTSLHRPTSPNALRSSSPESPSSSTSGSHLDSGGFSPLSRAPPSPTSPIKPQRLSNSVPKKVQSACKATESRCEDVVDEDTRYTITSKIWDFVKTTNAGLTSAGTPSSVTRPTHPPFDHSHGHYYLSFMAWTLR
ncbi:hypothetical protein FA13DRAFT_1399208 [Coprinellus micaceus]|uniref:Uncharacterized protein n=1 Tax=Coprinellus micaceus TaxID=71717 RepID=A0A4Y7SPW9_COPMI|nr:hypothetical protein FA13DRAFT_1399208 [Coprinellus micaceus]